jgi:flagella basal body P-ring formation protein FlgA
MGKFIFIFVFSLLSLHANTLQQNYLFSKSIITSSDINASCSKIFEILRIPDGKSSYRINAQVILKTFELNDCTIDIGKIRYVNFSKQSDTDYAVLQEQIGNLFLEQYPNIVIQSIHIFPHGYIESLPNAAKAVFDKNTCIKNKGTFYVPDNNGIRHYFDFTIDASLNMLHTNKKVFRKDIVSLNNCSVKTIPFDSFRGAPLIAIPDTISRFRSSLKEGSPVLDRNIEPLPLVLRGSRVSVQVKNGAVIVEFIATAMQEGALYDIITIEKADGKRSRAKIIGDNRVELQ